MIEFTDRDFVAAHGCKPRGYGQWAFGFANEVLWEEGTLTQAKARVRRRLKQAAVELGYIVVEVLA